MKTEQQLSREAEETALTLIENHGRVGAEDWVARALNAGTDRGGFWLRVLEHVRKWEE
jgi:hypothetical protein